MLALRLAVQPALLLCLVLLPLGRAWEPTWESLDSRPLPPWFDEAKFGIFIHWGVFSVPSFGSEWFWWYWRGAQSRPEYVDFVRRTERPGFAYPEYADRFGAALYDPERWADLFADAGAQYVVLTSKHHEGYCMWDSRDVPATWNWNALDVGPHRDVFGELAAAIKKKVSKHTGRRLKWGAYHSMFEWFNPDFLADKASGFRRTHFRDHKTMPELYDLVQKYEPELIWSDGAAGPDAYWNGPEFLAWYATNSSVAETAVWNDRWSTETNCKHGAYINCADRFRPGKLVAKKWENAMTIDSGSWGYNRNASYSAYLSTESLIHQLIETVAYGGNLLLNVGPAHDGTIDPIFADRLMGIGSWLKVNGEAIYATVPWTVEQNETAAGVFYTAKPATRTVYAIATVWPRGTGNPLLLEAPATTAATKVRMVGVAGGENLDWYHPRGGAGISIRVPALTPDKLPCMHAWVFALTGLANDFGVSESIL